jgi:hypothetical protein
MVGQRLADAREWELGEITLVSNFEPEKQLSAEQRLG